MNDVDPLANLDIKGLDCTNQHFEGLGPHHTPSGLGCSQSLDVTVGGPSGCLSPTSFDETSVVRVQVADVLVVNEDMTGCPITDCSSVEIPDIHIQSVEEKIGLDDFTSGSSHCFSALTASSDIVIDSFHKDYIGIQEVSLDGDVFYRPCDMSTCSRNHSLGGVQIQLNPCAFFAECFCHPNGIDEQASYIFQGIRDGFTIVDREFGGSYFCSNYSSILDVEFRSQMDDTIASELSEGKVSISVDRPRCVHALGAVKKGNGKLRPITDCRRPEGVSINNYMNTTCQEFTFLKLDEVADYMTPNCWFAVLDLKAAYRSVHIAPQDRTHQGFMWNWDGQERYFLDNRLCFGLKCAPYIFSRLTEFIVRSMGRRGGQGVFGYLDDFLVVADSREECLSKLYMLIALLRNLGFGIAWDKIISPSQSVVYLGIEIDSVNLEFRLPTRKVDRLKSLVAEFQHKTKATKKELQVLAGHLAHASTVVRGGRTFSRRLINLVKYLDDSNRIISLPEWFLPDLQWWSSLLEVFNGSAKVIKTVCDLGGLVSTDSSKSGFGGVWNDDWFLGSWISQSDPNSPPDHHIESAPSSYTVDMNINILELWPVVVAAQRWGSRWSGMKVKVMTDNTQVLHMINTGRSSSVNCMFWIRELFWISFIYNFQLVASHISTSDNIIPDFLSRFFSEKNIAMPTCDLTDSLCCFQDWIVSTSRCEVTKGIG